MLRTRREAGVGPAERVAQAGSGAWTVGRGGMWARRARARGAVGPMSVRPGNGRSYSSSRCFAPACVHVCHSVAAFLAQSFLLHKLFRSLAARTLCVLQHRLPVRPPSAPLCADWNLVLTACPRAALAEAGASDAGSTEQLHDRTAGAGGAPAVRARRPRLALLHCRRYAGSHKWFRIERWRGAP